MTEKTTKLIEETTERREIIVNPDKEPLNYLDIVRNLGIAGTPVPAKNLIDSTFDIIRAKEFDSSFKDGEHAYYCVVKPVDASELYSVVLGGGAVVEVLDMIANSNIDNAIRVTLRFKEGGKFNGYYFFE